MKYEFENMNEDTKINKPKVLKDFLKQIKYTDSNNHNTNKKNVDINKRK